jgi:CheY-like chemotaxis protein/HPt (histidine-containing phosphotransfer) domain-containing protein
VFDLRATIEGAAGMIAPAAGAKHLNLKVSIAAGVPQRAIGDPGRLRQILLNLLGNAVKFTEFGGIELAVSCAAREQGGIRLTVAVADTGIGIAGEALPRLFREFSQVDGSISRRFGGSGLGLAISRRLVERMGGSLAVDSVLGEGSTFHFDVLLRAAPAGTRSADARPRASGRWRRLHILLAEDNATNCLVASRMLERMGHRVDTAANGREAVQAVRSIPYDLVLMDVMMPEMDGLAATRLIRAEPEPVGATPIIGLTAKADSGSETECRVAGMNGFVSKPVNAERLEQAMMAAAAQAWPLLDERVLRRLADDIGDDGVLEVVRLFIAESPAMIQRLERACTTGGRPLLREVHTLASAARSVGLLRAGHCAGDIEHAMAEASPDPERLADLLEVLRAGVERLADWAEQPHMAAAAT